MRRTGWFFIKVKSNGAYISRQFRNERLARDWASGLMRSYPDTIILSTKQF